MAFWEQLYPNRLYHLDYDRHPCNSFQPETKALLANLGLQMG